MRTGKRTKALILAITIILLLSSRAQTVSAAENIASGSEADATPVYERIIAHGGGAYRGYETSNSVEAINNAIASGYKVIELDMELSLDHKIIMLHDWDRTAAHYYGTSYPKKLSQSQFMKLSVFGELEVLTFEKLVEIMIKNPDIRIVTDTKGDNLEMLTFLSKNYPDLQDRFIPQIYHYDQWDPVRELGFSDIIFTLYAIADLNAKELAAFVKDHDVYAVAMPDYVADRGVCKELADQGIVVYIHPVSNYESALQYMAQGAYGVYSGSLLPEEFSGIEKEYFFLEPGADGASLKLTDDRVLDWNELKLHGQKPGDTVQYYLDRSRHSASDADIAKLEPGKHKLTISILDRKEPKGSLVYYLYKDTNTLRVLHKKYEYRLDGFQRGRDFASVMEEAGVEEDIRKILEQSLIARRGDHSFYANGIQELYMNGEELLPVQKGNNGKLLLPLGTTLKRLGAESVTMSRDKDITIVYHNEKSRIMANTNILRPGYLRPVLLRNKVVLYLNKAMAAGEFYQYITGRSYIEQDGIIILLPAGLKSNPTLEKNLVKAAGNLF